MCLTGPCSEDGGYTGGVFGVAGGGVIVVVIVVGELVLLEEILEELLVGVGFDHYLLLTNLKPN